MPKFKFLSKTQKFIDEASGATLVEYGVALILAIIVGGTGLSQLADETTQNMDETTSALNYR